MIQGWCEKKVQRRYLADRGLRTANNPSTVKWVQKIWHFVASCIYLTSGRSLSFLLLCSNYNQFTFQWVKLWNCKWPRSSEPWQWLRRKPRSRKSKKQYGGSPHTWAAARNWFFSGQQAVVDPSEGGRHLLASAVNLLSSSSSSRRWTWEVTVLKHFYNREFKMTTASRSFLLTSWNGVGN